MFLMMILVAAVDDDTWRLCYGHGYTCTDCDGDDTGSFVSNNNNNYSSGKDEAYNLDNDTGSKNGMQIFFVVTCVDDDGDDSDESR